MGKKGEDQGPQGVKFQGSRMQDVLNKVREGERGREGRREGGGGSRRGDEGEGGGSEGMQETSNKVSDMVSDALSSHPFATTSPTLSPLNPSHTALGPRRCHPAHHVRAPVWRAGH